MTDQVRAGAPDPSGAKGNGVESSKDAGLSDAELGTGPEKGKGAGWSGANDADLGTEPEREKDAGWSGAKDATWDTEPETEKGAGLGSVKGTEAEMVEGAGPGTAPESAKDDALGDGERCALEGCELPLPPRGLDQQGRAKGGRRPQYCSKAHADAASRQRRAREVASVEDPLSLARSAGEAFLPGARALAAQLGELIARFDEAEAGALARVQAAEQEASSATADALAARESAEAAEQGRRAALAQARQDRQARDNAIKEAGRARSEAEQVRTAAWEQVAVHERGRGQAEAARLAAQASADALIGQNRELREQGQQAQKARAEMTALLADTRQDQERAEGVNRALSARVEAVERLSAREAERLRDQVDVLQSRVGELQAELAGATATAKARSEQVSGLQAELTALRALQSDTQNQLGAVQVELATARAELVAARSQAVFGVVRSEVPEGVALGQETEGVAAGQVPEEVALGQVESARAAGEVEGQGPAGDGGAAGDPVEPETKGGAAGTAETGS